MKAYRATILRVLLCCKAKLEEKNLNNKTVNKTQDSIKDLQQEWASAFISGHIS